VSAPTCPTWAEMVAAARDDGATEYRPNGLPVACIRADGALLEHEHADHPDYLFPVTVTGVALGGSIQQKGARLAPESVAKIVARNEARRLLP
jgi:hypothetical protein